MKKFSTAALILALTTLFTPLQTFAASKNKCEFLPNAPDKHIVVRGDTLWDISGKFLANPWCWPKVWGMNSEQIKNPHWIYPGQIVYFDRATGRLRLASTPYDARLSPKIRSKILGEAPIPTISHDAIGPFLSRALIVKEDELDKYPRIMASQEGRVYLSKGDRAYVRGDLENMTLFEVFRPAQPLKDPDTKEVLAYEAAHLGAVKLHRRAEKENEAHSFTVTETVEEMGVRDRLVAVPQQTVMNYVPHAPEKPVEAKIVAIYGGVTHAGQNRVVPINRGSKDGVDVGTVLKLYRAGKTIEDPTDNKNEVKLPDEEYGTLFIFRVFDNISYGLIMEVRDAAHVGDIARSPE